MPSAKEDWSVKPGDVLGGKYRVERVLGSGGMGVVVAARHVELRTRFALKLMRADAARDPDNVERFLREARAAVKLRGEHCVHVIDVGRLDDGMPYMVMELLAGQDLGALVDEAGPLGTEDAALYVLQACEGIAEAHARGIVHRDLKLANLVLTRRVDGRPLVKVLDFGLAKTMSSSRELRALTQTSAVMGSPMYMSPEQMRASRDVDTRTDVWSLGVCLYELLTGKLPFDAATVPEVCSLVLTQAPSPLPPKVPPALAEVVIRCLQKSPAARFRDVAELAAALEPFAPEPGSAARICRVLAEPPDELDSMKPPGPGTLPAASRAAPGRAEVDAAVTRTAATLETASHPRDRRAMSLQMGAGLVAGLLVVAVVAIVAQSLRAPAAVPEAASTDVGGAAAVIADTPPALPPLAATLPTPPPAASSAASAAAPPSSGAGTTPAGRAPTPAASPRRGAAFASKLPGASTPAAPVLQPKTTQF